MDLTIPGGMGGEEALQGLKKIDTDAKAVVSSGYSNDPIMINCLDYSFSGKATKPHSIGELRKILQEGYGKRDLKKLQCNLKSLIFCAAGKAAQL